MNILKAMFRKMNTSGDVVFVSSSSVCATKKLFIRVALSSSLV